MLRKMWPDHLFYDYWPQITPEGLYIGCSDDAAGQSSLPEHYQFNHEPDHLTTLLYEFFNHDSFGQDMDSVLLSNYTHGSSFREASLSSPKTNLPHISSSDAGEEAAYIAPLSQYNDGMAPEAEPLRVNPSIAVLAPAPTVNEKEATQVSLQNGESGREGDKDSANDRVEGKNPAVSAKRKRVTEIQNLCERRRRDRINVKMKTLQELIPRCNKSDKASTLAGAAEYMKTLQSQVKQVGDMVYGGVNPVARPGVQPCISPIGMSRPVFPYQPDVHGVASHLGQSLPIPPVTIPHLPLISDQTIIAQAATPAPFQLFALPIANAPRPLMNLPHPYQQHYLALQPVPLSQQVETNAIPPKIASEKTNDSRY